MAEAAASPPRESVKETLISIVIAFVMAFVFRGFVIEAFVIPTGSMAPTLLGQHMRFTSPATGATWTVGPWDYAAGSSDPLPRQGVPPAGPVAVTDPMSGARGEHRDEPLRAGDRIVVLKYLYALFEPKRFDVFVFKNPSTPDVNFIKRLIGLPNQQLALVDGDVFVRPVPPGTTAGPGWADWGSADWQVAVKPEAVDREVWQPVFDSAFSPLSETDAGTGQRWFRSPWVGEVSGGAGSWTIDGVRAYTFSGSATATLRWNPSTPLVRGHGNTFPVGEDWAINDRTAYNENPRTPNPPQFPRFPVGDVRLRATARFEAAPEFAAVVQARGHEFRGLVESGRARVQMRAQAQAGQPEEAWETLGEGTVPAGFAAGRAVEIEFWHVDQTLALYLNGTRVARGQYAWTPAQRVEFALGTPLETLVKSNLPTALQLGNPLVYRPVGVAWTFKGGPVTLERVALDRDLYYRPDIRFTGDGQLPGWATHPTVTMTLGPDQFFGCGDNSPASEDSRKWGPPDPWASLIDPTAGVIPRELLLGKAFFVYFPALAGDGPVPMPDFGRMRFIR